jgi:hypothetical protein
MKSKVEKFSGIVMIDIEEALFDGIYVFKL